MFAHGVGAVLSTIGQVLLAITAAIVGALGSLVARLFGRDNAHAGHPNRRAGQRGSRSARGQSMQRTPSAQAASAFRLPVVLGSALCGAALIFLLSLAVATTPAGIDATAEASMLNMSTLDGGSLPYSTPREQWQQGSVPYFFQTDPIWAQQPYAGDTVAVNGCGPTCLAMVYVCITGNTDMSPADMAAFADEGNYAPTGATEWSFMTEGAAQLGLTSTELSLDRDAIIAALQAGQPVICAVRPGDFTAVGHFIVLSDVDENGMVTVHDPNSSYRSAQKWSVDRILAQTRICWSYT